MGMLGTNWEHVQVEGDFEQESRADGGGLWMCMKARELILQVDGRVHQKMCMRRHMFLCLIMIPRSIKFGFMASLEQ